MERVRFGDPGWRLGYARDALNSYFVFQTMKEKGVLPAHLRFQVSVPMVNSVLPPRIFPNQGDLAKIRPGYEAAIRAELATIIEQDSGQGARDPVGLLDGGPRRLRQHPRLSARGFDRAQSDARCATSRRTSRPDVALGYHFCFGTLGGWPRFQPDDLGKAVELANGFVAASGRKVDWIHIPVLDRSDDAFFAPLKHLEPQGARVYLGMIHNMAGFKARLQTARKYLPAFGLGAYCGFGRMPVSELPKVLADHLEAAEIASSN